MSIRREPTYLATDTWRALLIVSKSKEITPDELADDLLSEVLRAKYPNVIKYLNEVHKLERDIIKTLEGNHETVSTTK